MSAATLRLLDSRPSPPLTLRPPSLSCAGIANLALKASTAMVNLSSTHTSLDWKPTDRTWTARQPASTSYDDASTYFNLTHLGRHTRPFRRGSMQVDELVNPHVLPSNGCKFCGGKHFDFEHDAVLAVAWTRRRARPRLAMPRWARLRVPILKIRISCEMAVLALASPGERNDMEVSLAYSFLEGDSKEDGVCEYALDIVNPISLNGGEVAAEICWARSAASSVRYFSIVEAEESSWGRGP